MVGVWRCNFSGRIIGVELDFSSGMYDMLRNLKCTFF